MQQKIQIFKHEQFGRIRTMVDEKGEPWFVGKDVAQALGYTNTRDALNRHVDEEDKTTVGIHDGGSNYTTASSSSTKGNPHHHRGLSDDKKQIVLTYFYNHHKNEKRSMWLHQLPSRYA